MTDDRPQDLVGGRLQLRPWADDDLIPLIAILGDPEVMRYSLSGAMDQIACATWLAQQMALSLRAPLGSWAITRRSDKTVLGYIRLTRTETCAVHGDVELGIRLARTAWGQGLAKEAVGLVRSQRGADCTRLLAVVDPENTRSVALLRSLGLRFERSIMLPGYDHPDHLYAGAF